MIRHLRGNRQADAPPRRQEGEFVARRRHADGRRRVAPLWQEGIERAGLEDRARERMGTEACALFEHADAEVRAQLLQADRAGESRRACPDDGDLVLHDVPLDVSHTTLPRRRKAQPVEHNPPTLAKFRAPLHSA